MPWRLLDEGFQCAKKMMRKQIIELEILVHQYENLPIFRYPRADIDTNILILQLYNWLGLENVVYYAPHYIQNTSFQKAYKSKVQLPGLISKQEVLYGCS
jgi:hypothetical protein